MQNHLGPCPSASAAWLSNSTGKINMRWNVHLCEGERNTSSVSNKINEYIVLNCSYQGPEGTNKPWQPWPSSLGLPHLAHSPAPYFCLPRPSAPASGTPQQGRSPASHSPALPWVPLSQAHTLACPCPQGGARHLVPQHTHPAALLLPGARPCFSLITKLTSC